MRILMLMCVMLTPIWGSGQARDFSLPALPHVRWTHARVISTIIREARAEGVDPALALAIAEIESSLNPRVHSRWEGHLNTYSVGLFQVLHTTARDEFGFRGSIEQLRNPENNIRLGVRYLSRCESQSLKEFACCYQAGFYADSEFCEQHEGVQNYFHKLERKVAWWSNRIGEEND